MSTRTSQVICGIAVLLTSITFAHLTHHMFIVHWSEFSLAWRTIGLGIMIPIGIFSFIGAYLLLAGPRRSSATSPEMK